MLDFSQPTIQDLTQLGGFSGLPGDLSNLGGIALMPRGLLAGGFVYDPDGLGGGEWTQSTLMSRNTGPDHLGLGGVSGRLQALFLMRPETNQWFLILYHGARLGETDDYPGWGADLQETASPNAAAVPEPGALFLLGTGLCALAERRRRAIRQQIAPRS